MKKITLIALFAVVATLFACKKDKAERNSDRLNGKWSLESMAYVYYEDGKEIEREQKSGLNLPWEFRTDGKATVKIEGDTQETNWTATESTLEITSQGGDQKLKFDIKSLSKTDLHLEYESDVDFENGKTYREVVEFKLKKK
ncbi:lipocalin family protein [Pedobacter frigoris]|uniref:lipocalin family protein n=1 Tax=Pedobacter frigoris TaxID=2571272 RepID=UPI0029301393|nr:lipocalin family protein [Pedobacter frigoris]